MRDRDKTRQQLLRELTETRRRYEKLAALYKNTAGGAVVKQQAGIVIDIIDHVHPEDALSCRASELQAIFHALPDLYFQLDAQGTILDLKAGRASDLYFTHESLIGKRIQDVHPRVGKQFEQAIRQVLSTRSLSVIEYAISCRQDEQFYEARLAPLRENWIVVVIRNITERKQAEEQLRFLSLYDPLTRLYNRTYFEKEMRRLEGGRSYPVGIIVCDVDGLKLVNDTLGHNAGDAMLAEAANVIRNAFRQGEMVARIGGDEFAVILPGVDRQVMEDASNRIRQAVISYNAADPELPLSISIGFAVCSDAFSSMDETAKEADNNMYREKLYRSRTASSAIIKTLMNTLKARGIATEEQTARIQELVAGLAASLGLGKQRMADIFLLVRFHDIGKIGVPGHILFKPGPLGPEEIAEIQRHCEVGHRIAQAAPELAPVADWILKHHEWFNGHGYPLGLKGDEIPLECRLLAIAGAYDAMTSERPYRSATTADAAFTELEKGSGMQFDPVLVAEFLKLYRCNPVQKAT